MIKHTRQQAKALGLPTCYGSLCQKHPELDGLRRVSGSCVECAKERLRKGRASNPERTAIQHKKDYEKYRQKPELVAKKQATDRVYRKANKEKCAAVIASWSLRNPEKVKLYAQKTKKKHKGKRNAECVSRRLSKVQRTPAWADRSAIQNYYDVCAFFNDVNGFIKYHVDHVIPLNGDLVSGLHVHNNLQVIPWQDNVSKGNRYEVM